MKSIQSQSRIGYAMLVFSLLLGIGIALGTTAQAQYPNDRNAQERDRGRNWDRYGNYGGSSQLRETALNAGYNEGLQQSRNDRNDRNDRNRGNRSDYHELSVYQNATKDYSRRLGDRELYQRYFREAFESGYNAEGYARGYRVRDDRNGNRDLDRDDNGNQNRRGRNWDQYGNYGGSFQLRQTALNAGYNEGIKQGHSDRNKRNGNGNGYQDQSAYRKATKDYSTRLGDREVYRRYYREAYENGYAAGINGY